MSRFMHPQYASLKAYVPGEQPRDRSYIKLNTNESPYPPSPAVLRAINAEEASRLCLYSDPENRGLKEGFEKLYGISSDRVFLSNGSDDILNFAFMAFGADGVVFPAISYGFYKVFAERNGLNYEMIPLCTDFSIDPTAYFNQQKMVVIANPNAPTGIALDLDDVERIVKENPNHVVLIDEAYVDFGAESARCLIDTYDNLLVVGTFSKSRSMAGARLGFAFGNSAIISDLEKLQYSTNPYAINRLTQAAGAAALEEDSYYIENCRRIQDTRALTADGLAALGFEVLPSSANFLFARHPAVDGLTVYQRLRENGILVRHFDAPLIQDFNRITIGSREEMIALLEAMRAIVTKEATV